MAAETPKRFTETPNELSQAIDVASGVEGVRILRSVDAALFSGFQDHPGLFDDTIVDAASDLAAHIATAAQGDGIPS